MAFQVVFGLAVFAITRQYYVHPIFESGNVGDDAPVVGQLLPEWADNIRRADLAQIRPPALSGRIIEDPVEISRQANEFFANERYDRAADLYEQLLAFGPDNVDTINNLGITLYYLGRSTEALGRLNEGVAIDPTHQRIWLTLGFVNSQLGNIEQARTALSTAAQMGIDNEVGQSAASMLENLP